ncbi:MAG: tetratricopeptide repeat protein [Lewinella sp.]|nr:tetratricopeptide repeat protein [Lewinella sp.]
MTKLQRIVILIAVGLFLLLYFGVNTPFFGLSTKSNEQRQLEKTRSLQAESTDISVLLKNAKSALSSAQSGRIFLLEQSLAETQEDSARIEQLQQLSGTWFDLGHPAIAGYYAQEIAEIAGTAESWSIAGTTYTICLQQATEEKVREYCSGRAVSALENAISLDPDQLAHQVNLSLVYTENPSPDDPMRGILMLRELNEAHPNNVLVMNTLARLAIKTGQFDRAIERLERSLELDADNQVTVCLLAAAYQGAGNENKAAEFAARCNAQ